MKYIVHINSDKDTDEAFFIVDSFKEVGEALLEYSDDYCEPFLSVDRFDIEVIPALCLRKENKS